MLNTEKERELLFQVLDKKQIKISEKDIAIIGLSGRYSGAESPEELWEIVSKGESVITEIPPDRWDCAKYYDPEPSEGKMYCKWGGFIDDVYAFDPLFFHISPKNAEMMDPQVRKLLETAWYALEDGGHKPLHNSPQNVGVFMGVTTYTYDALLLEENFKGNSVTPATDTSGITNLISHFFNFTGPSIPVDTACSSSLTAIHLACKSIKTGECKMALAGGVNLYLHPSKYIHLSQLRILSKDDKTRSFGKGGTGYVPGEGVGAVLLKPMPEAVRDGDYIYGIIKGSAINNWGRSSMYMAPNPAGQADLIIRALNDADVHPETISYIEAQGMGSDISDASEISCLTRAYKHFLIDNQFVCPLGSVKPNIGHPEAVSGMAQLTKVLLQLKHKKLAPSLNSEEANPNIDFENSPFYIQHELSEWKQALIRENGKTKRYPRRAGISSFGGGTGAYLIIEEFENVIFAPKNLDNVVIVLSAANKERLKEYARKLADFLKKPSSTSGYLLSRIAYTLQTGRTAMRERLAAVVSETDELIEKLEKYCQGVSRLKHFYTGNTKKSDMYSKSSPGEKENKLCELARLWVSGADTDWQSLHQGGAPSRIPLPTYPFEKERYCIPDDVNFGRNEESLSVKESDMNRADNHLGVDSKLSSNNKSDDEFNTGINLLKTITQPELSEKQKKFILGFTEEYSERTHKSKEEAAKFDNVFADQKRPVRFLKLLKEIHYRVVCKEAEGAYVHDINNNKYIDISGDMGVNLFGHQAPFIKEAIIKALNQGISLSCCPELVGKTARLFSELTGHDRVMFSQSGSEAVMGAVRIARAATEKSKIVIFEGAFHGVSDVVLASKNKSGSSFAPFPGLMQSYADDLIVLDYGKDDQLEIIENNADNIAGVLVEPIQSRHLDLQPVEFLKKLRVITSNKDIPLIFDEMITGFRIHPGGVQGYLNIKADLATYGKIPGGGMPTGVIAGSSKLMGWIDGGKWKFGDNSSPNSIRTFLAGTHTQNPLKIAAMHAVLTELKRQGPKLQRKLNERTENMAEELNNFFSNRRLPVKITYFGSLFRFVFLYPHFGITEALFPYLLRINGVETSINGSCFLTTAHTEQDIGNIVEAVKTSMDILLSEDFFYEGEDIEALNNNKRSGKYRRTSEIELINLIRHDIDKLTKEI